MCTYNLVVTVKIITLVYHLPIVQLVLTLQMQTKILGPKVTKVAVPDIFSIVLLITHNTSF